MARGGRPLIISGYCNDEAPGPRKVRGLSYSHGSDQIVILLVCSQSNILSSVRIVTA